MNKKVKDNAVNECLKLLFKSSLDTLEMIDKLVTHLDLRNSQEFIEWQDKLNEISIREN